MMKKVGLPKLGLATVQVIAGLLVLWLIGRSNSQPLVTMPPTAPNLLINTDFKKITNNLPDSWIFDRSLNDKGSVKIVRGGSRPETLSLCLIPNGRNNDSAKPLALAQMISPEPLQWQFCVMTFGSPSMPAIVASWAQPSTCKVNL